MSKVVIIQFPGVNCEYESLRVVEEVGLEGEPALIIESPEALTKKVAGALVTK